MRSSVLFSRSGVFCFLAFAAVASGQTPFQEAYLKNSPLAVGVAGAKFGHAVDVGDNVAVVGAPWESSGAVGVNTSYPISQYASGAVCVFERQGNWTLTAYLKPFNTSGYDWFGWSVALSGDTIVVGAPNEQSANATAPFDESLNTAGAAYIFVRDPDNGAWSQQAFLKSSNATFQEQFGWAVDVDGDRAVIGAPGYNGSQGAAYVFRRVAGNWTQEAFLLPGNTPNNGFFGRSVSISGNTVIIGTPFDHAAGYSAGSAYVFSRNSTTGNWAQTAYLFGPHTESGDDFGSAVSISGDVAVVGAPRESGNATGVGGDQTDNSASLSGAAYVFRRSSGNWSFEAYLKASNTGEYDRFGSSLAVEGDVILVGAAHEQGNATGVNGNQTNNEANRAGAAYRFTRTNGTWTGTGYLKASNTEEAGGPFDTLDEFGGPTDGYYAIHGQGVALHGSTAIVGAALEDSAASGVGGNQTDESATDAGAAYIFENITTPEPDIALEQPEGTPLTSNGSTVNFGLAIVGGDAQREFMLRNFGSGNLSVTSFAFSGLNAGDFLVVAAPAAPISAGGAGSFRVRFAPTVLGTRTANLTFTTNDPDQGTFVVRLSGLAVCVDEPGGSSAYVRIQQDAYVKASNTENATGNESWNEDGDQFGFAVAISGNLMVIGAPGEDGPHSGGIHAGLPMGQQELNTKPDAGAAYVFARNATTGTWAQEIYLKSSPSWDGDRFGSAVAISGNTVVVGAPFEDRSSPGVNGPYNAGAEDSGAAYVHVRNATTGEWQLQAVLKSSYPAARTDDEYVTGAGQKFGFSVAISGDTVLVGAPDERVTPPGDLGEGAVYVFVRSSGVWSVEERLLAPIPTSDFRNFGAAVAISGNTAVVTENYEAKAYVFERDGGGWGESMLLPRSDGGGLFNGDYGRSAAIDGESLWGDTIVIGAPIAGEGLNGRANVFVRDGVGGWIEQAILTPPPGQEFPESVLQFGESVSISGDTILVGAPGDSSDATGINGYFADLSRGASGAAFEFERIGPTWSQKSYLKAHNPDVGDNFGSSVAVSGRIGVVGALFEQSNARGVGGNGFDNSSEDAGAAYVFRGLRPEAEIEIARADSAQNVANNATVTFDSTPPGRNRTIQFTMTNIGDRNLTLSPHPIPDISLAGDVGHFSVTQSPADPVTAGNNTTFTILFAPSGTGNRSATAIIGSSDLDEGTYTIHLTGYAPTATEDNDGDGILDAAEFDLEAAGFRAGQNDSARVAAIVAGAPEFDLYDPADMQALLVDTPLIFRDPGTGNFTLTMGLRKSTDLSTFNPLPVTANQTFINPQGKIEVEIESPDPRAFFQILAE
jgi:hypothetical protein